ncbi:MAG TPA: DNA primase [Methylomirabilota bacterium]|nr:DNA primase [Methylomirabilota bacterium]
MPVIDQSSIEQVRNANDIVDVIGASLPLKRAGGAFVALCPFHKEKTPSFNVNPHKQIFHCFGCHKGGDVFKWVQEYEGLSFPEAIERLAQRAGIMLQTTKPVDGQQTALKEKLLTIHDQLAQRWHSALLNEASGQIGRDYLAKRGVSLEAIKLFRIGHAPDVWDDTVNWARTKGHDLKLVEQCGLIARKEGSEHHYDRFKGRLMFPIADEQGRVIAFSGRTLRADEPGGKYVNSPETLLFKKSRVMYALDKAKRPMIDAKHAIICEGQLDAIAIFMSGIENVVAPQGTAFTADHARILKRYVDEVVLCFDADNAGQKAAVRALDDLLASGLSIRVASIPAPHDPDSFIKEHGPEAFRHLIQTAGGFFDFYLERLCATNDLTTDRGRLTVLKAMAEGVQKTGSQLLINDYARKTALRLGVSPQAVQREFASTKAKPAAQRGEAAQEEPLPPEETLPGRTSPEFWLVRLLMLSDEHIQWAVQHLEPGWIENGVARQVVGGCFDEWCSGRWSGVAAFTQTLEENPSASKLVTEAVCEQRPLGNPEEVLKGTATHAGLVVRIRDRYLDRQILALTSKLEDARLSEEERLAALQERVRLRQMKGQPLMPLGEA